MERAPGRIGVAGDWHGNTKAGAELSFVDGNHADRGNWAILDVTSMRWLRFAGRPISNALRGLVSR